MTLLPPAPLPEGELRCPIIGVLRLWRCSPSPLPSGANSAAGFTSDTGSATSPPRGGHTAHALGHFTHSSQTRSLPGRWRFRTVDWEACDSPEKNGQAPPPVGPNIKLMI